MPKGQSFTRMCQQLAQLAQPRKADLHLHTTFSDGDYTLSQVIAKATQARLKKIAITDHDTYDALDHVPENTKIDIIPGIELTAIHREHELHLLAYYFDPDNIHVESTLSDDDGGPSQSIQSLFRVACSTWHSPARRNG